MLSSYGCTILISQTLRNVCDFNPSIRGRYIRIQSEGVLSLELAEVQVSTELLL